MTFIKWCGCAVVCVVAAMLLRPRQGEFASVAVTLCGVFFIGSTIAALAPVFDTVREFYDDGGSEYTQYFGVLLKCAALTAASSVTAEICRDCGEASVAKKVEMLACAEILLLCLPLVGALLSSAKDMLG